MATVLPMVFTPTDAEVEMAKQMNSSYTKKQKQNLKDAGWSNQQH
jgi:hypothetical protein